jgi:hypothetical protein
MKRRRVSSEGQLLLKLAYTNEEIIIKKPILSRHRIKEFFCGLFHTDYDNKLEAGTTQLYSSGRKLYTFTKDCLESIPEFMNNAIANIILLIITNEGRIATKFEAKRNYRFYMDLAKKAFNIKDHNTCIMIMSALINPAIERLKLKQRKTDIEFKKIFEEKYGSFKSNCMKHIKQFTNEISDKSIEIPSLMMMLINLKRLNEIEKVMKTQGRKTIIKLQDLIDFYYELFQYEEDMDFIMLYTQQPEENIVIQKLIKQNKSMKNNDLWGKIFEISNTIVPPRRNKA